LADDDQALAEMGRKGRARLLSEFDISNTHCRLLSLYADVLGVKTPDGCGAANTSTT
jgi:hypothetical protein